MISLVTVAALLLLSLAAPAASSKPLCSTGSPLHGASTGLQKALSRPLRFEGGGRHDKENVAEWAVALCRPEFVYPARGSHRCGPHSWVQLFDFTAPHAPCVGYNGTASVTGAFEIGAVTRLSLVAPGSGRPALAVLVQCGGDGGQAAADASGPDEISVGVPALCLPPTPRPTPAPLPGRMLNDTATDTPLGPREMTEESKQATRFVAIAACVFLLLGAVALVKGFSLLREPMPVLKRRLVRGMQSALHAAHVTRAPGFASVANDEDPVLEGPDEEELRQRTTQVAYDP